MSETAQSRRRRSPAGVIGDILLWPAAAGGVLCIALVIAATVFHVTLIMFKTGSMEPTIPTGSLAVVHEIAASEARVGDIVTVDRPGQLPVTHRVTSVSDAPGGATSLTLRGDANRSEDPAPYVVKHVRVVWAWVPGWARVVVWFSNPLVLGTLTVGVTALVTWAFWPRDERRGRRRRGTPLATPAVIIVAIATAGTLVGGPASPAHADEVETVVSSDYLTLTSVGDPELLSQMQTGSPLLWEVGVDATPPEPGDVHIGLAASGALVEPGMIELRVDGCAERWVAGVCAPGAVTWLPPTDLTSAVLPVTAHGAHEIGVIDSSEPIWLMMTVTMVAASAPSKAVADIRLQTWGVGTLAVGPGELAMTGPAAGTVLAPLLLALAGVGSGIGIALLGGRRRRGRP